MSVNINAIPFDRVTQGVWLLICLTIGGVLFANPSLLTPESIQSTVLNYGATAFWIYILLSMVRGFFLIPSTPFVLAGVAMYPDDPAIVISISMVGILFSATLLYFFSKKLGFSGYLERKYPSGINATKELLNGNRAMMFVAGWSFFPLVPTDVICYVAGLIPMPFTKMILGLFIGELVLVSCYVYLGRGLLSFF